MVQHSGHHGLQPWSVRPPYKAYKSPFGPQYKIEPHFHGYSLTKLSKFGFMTAGFAASAGIFAVFFFAEVPRMREDVMQKIPIIGDMFVKEIPPEDNPF